MIEMLFPISVVLFILTIGLLAINPVLGIPLLFISKPFIDTTFEHPVLFDFRMTELIGVLVPALILCHMILASREESFSRMPLKGMWVVYVSYVFFFSLLIVFQEDLRSGANVFFRHFNGLVGFYMVQAFFLPPQRRVWLLRSLIVAGLFPVGIGFIQMATGVTWKVEHSEGLLRNIGLWHDAVNIRQYMLQTLLVLLLYGAVYTGRQVWKKLGVFIYMIGTVIVCIKAFSKSGMATLVLWTGCWGLLFRKYAVFVIPMMGILLFGGLLAADLLGSVLQVFQKEIGFLQGDIAGTRTFAGRWHSWQALMAEWQTYDWFLKIFGSGRVAIGAHNDYLQLLFHGGFLGLSCYVMLLGTIGVKLFLNLRRALTPMNMAAGMAFLMWMVDTIGLVPSAYPGFQWFVWGLVGLSLRVQESEDLVIPSSQPVATDRESEAHHNSAIGRPEGSPKKFPLLIPPVLDGPDGSQKKFPLQVS